MTKTTSYSPNSSKYNPNALSPSQRRAYETYKRIATDPEHEDPSGARGQYACSRIERISMGQKNRLNQPIRYQSQKTNQFFDYIGKEIKVADLTFDELKFIQETFEEVEHLSTRSTRDIGRITRAIDTCKNRFTGGNVSGVLYLKEPGERSAIITDFKNFYDQCKKQLRKIQ